MPARREEGGKCGGGPRMNPFSHRLHLHHLEAIVKPQLKTMR